MNKSVLSNLDHLSSLSIDEIDQAISTLPIMVQNHIMDETDADKLRYKLMTAKDKKILETYPIRMWQTKDGTWKAHVPDATKDRNRRILQGKTRENLENKILNDYKEKSDTRLVFSTYFAHWLVEYKSLLVKPPTIQRNFDDYRKFIKGTKIDSMKITEITRADLKKYLNDAIVTYQLTRKALNNLKSIFTQLFEYAFDSQDITVNPAFNLKIENTNIRQEQTKFADTEIFNEQECDVFIEYLYNHYREHRPIVTLALLLNFQLGLRVGELCCIRKSDIDDKHLCIAIDRMERSYRPVRLENGVLVEDKTVHEVAEGEVKKNSHRIIYLSEEAQLIIKETLRVQEELGIESEYLFPDENGEHVIRQRFNDCIRFYCQKLEIDVKSSHKIRKTVLSNLFRNGWGFDEIMRISGHRNKDTLMKYYLFSVRKEEDNCEKMSSALSTGHTFGSQP